MQKSFINVSFQIISLSHCSHFQPHGRILQQSEGGQRLGQEKKEASVDRPKEHSYGRIDYKHQSSQALRLGGRVQREDREDLSRGKQARG